MDVEFSETGDGMFHVDAQVVPTGLDTRESVSEDEEQIDELSPSTLKSYIKKASKNPESLKRRRGVMDAQVKLGIKQEKDR